MGYVPDWQRQSYTKVRKMADGGELPEIDADENKRTEFDTYGYTNARGVPNVGGKITHDLGGGNRLSVEGSVGGITGKDQNGQKFSDMNRWHRIGYSKDLGGDREVGVGVSGYGYRGERAGEKYSGGNDLATGDVRYRSGDAEYSASYTPENKGVRLTFRKRF